MSISDQLDMPLAFQRVRDEIIKQPESGRVFVANPLELDLIEVDLDGWLQELASRLDRGTYAPGPIEQCDAPKGNGLVRPAAWLGLADRVVYTAAVGACLRSIDKATRWSQGKADFAMRLDPSKLDARDWLRNPYKGWTEFRERTVQRMDSQALGWVLSADIAGFFENVSLELLRSDLVRIGCPREVVSLINSILWAWAVTPGRGLPQGVLASDILAKLYLETVDQHLRNEALVHLRYVDDLRVLTHTEAHAKRALVIVTRALRERGLTLQSAKTKIRRTEAARSEFEGVAPVIQACNAEVIEEAMARGLMAADESLPLLMIDDLIKREPGSVDAEVIRRAFKRHVIDGADPNPTLFRFALGQLRKAKDGYAVPYCSELLVEHPEHTPTILSYFASLAPEHDVIQIVSRTLSGPQGAIYPYQRYLLLDWLRRLRPPLSDEVLRVIRALAFRPESPAYLKASARSLVGEYGDHSDLERLSAVFRGTTEPLERAQTLVTLRRLEKHRRNTIAGRAKGEGGLVARAARLVRATG